MIYFSNMPYRAPLVTENYYHICNRGVDDRRIFLGYRDYNRFLELLNFFNVVESVTIRDCRLPSSVNYRGRESVQHPLVAILCFCLMPNHFHLLLKQLQDGGIEKFLRKITTGYANYFNTINQRRGVVFQGRFKSVLIESDAQLLHISRYIHLNVLDLCAPEWREGKVENWEAAKKHLENYPWSSYPIFIGQKKSDFCQPEILEKIFPKTGEYENFVRQWTDREVFQLRDVALE